MSNTSTKENLVAIRHAIKDTGLLVLDAHLTFLDIFYTALWFRKHFPKSRIVLPMAGYFTYVPIFRSLVKLFGRIFKLTLVPVFRSEESKPVNNLMKYLTSFYPKHVDSNHKHTKNEEYLNHAKMTLSSPNDIVVVAPYGGPLWFGRSIKKGVLHLISHTHFWCAAYTSSKYLFMKSTKISKLVHSHNRSMEGLDEFLLEKFSEVVDINKARAH